MVPDGADVAAPAASPSSLDWCMTGAPPRARGRLELVAPQLREVSRTVSRARVYTGNVPILPGPGPLWWSIRLVNYSTKLGLNTGTFSVLDPPPGYDPFTGEVNGSHGPFVTQEGEVLYTGAFHLRKVSMIFSRANEDVAAITAHILNLTGGNPDDTWIDADYTAVTARFVALWTALKSNYPPATHPEAYALQRITYHDVGSGVGRPNPVVRDIAENLPGTSSAAAILCPPQVAVSITFKTAVRKSWGRMFWPAPVTNVLDTNGRLTLSQVTAYRDAYSTWLDGLVADGFPPVVWRPRKNGALLGTFIGSDGKRHTDVPDATSTALTVDTVQVDDVLDVIRSRRYDHAINKLSHTRA
jgi:hypothetical protein